MGAWSRAGRLALLAILGCSRALELPEVARGAADLGERPDLAVQQTRDLSVSIPDLAAPDLAPRPDLAEEPGSLALVAGAPGGRGNANRAGGDARFNTPSAIAWDGGNLYVAEGGGAIRKIVGAQVSTLSLTQLVNGGIPNAPLAGLFGLFTDGAGHLFGSDSQYSVIRKVALATGEVTILAGSYEQPGSDDGTGSKARFYRPRGLARDASGNLYVADMTNDTIRKIVIATGEVSTFAGTALMSGSTDDTGANARFLEPHDLVWDGGGNLFVADKGNATIRQIALGDGSVTTLAGAAGQMDSVDDTGTSARFVTPEAITTDGAGSLYVADANTIRKIVIATGEVTTLAGLAGASGSADGIGAAARFNLPLGIASDRAGHLFVVDQSANVIRSVDLATRAVTTLAGTAGPNSGTSDGIGSAARFDNPYALAGDGAGHLFVSETNKNTIRRITLASGEVTTWAGLAGTFGSTDATGADARFHGPAGLATDGVGHLFVADFSNDTIRQIDLASAAVTTLAGTAGAQDTVDAAGAAARFRFPTGLASDGAGNLFVTSNDQTVRQIVIASGEVSTLAGTYGPGGSVDGIGAAARFSGPVGIVSDGAGSLYVADTDNCAIRKIAIASRKVTTVAGRAGDCGSFDGVGNLARFNIPVGLAIAPSGNLFVSDWDGGVIREIAIPSGAVTTPIGLPGQFGVVLGPLPGGLNRPFGLAMIGRDLLITDSAEPSVLIAHHPQ